MFIKAVETYYEDEDFLDFDRFPDRLSFWGVYANDTDDAYQWLAAFRSRSDAQACLDYLGVFFKGE